MPDGSWEEIAASPGIFVANFGEMLEFWTSGEVRATLHRVKGGPQERISVPLLFNPSYDTDVTLSGAHRAISAGEHLSQRYNETYLHLQEKL